MIGRNRGRRPCLRAVDVTRHRDSVFAGDILVEQDDRARISLAQVSVRITAA